MMHYKHGFAGFVPLSLLLSYLHTHSSYIHKDHTKAKAYTTRVPENIGKRGNINVTYTQRQ